MLYQVGPLTLDTFPFSVDKVEHEAETDFAKHELVGRRRDYEPVGEGEETLDLSGEFLPFRIGGLDQFALAHALRESAEPQFVMRGDGEVLGWYLLTKVKSGHEHIMPNGVGFVVKHSLHLERVDDASSGIAGDLISTLVSLF